MTSQILTKPLPYLALLIAHLIWGVNFVVAKITLGEFPVMSLAFLRFTLASILLLPFLLAFEKKQLKIKLEAAPKLFLVGLLMITVHISLFYEGLSRTTAIDASVLSMSVPIISVILGWLFLKEKIYWINLLGILLGFAGAITVLGLPLIFLGEFTPRGLMGNILIILASVSFVVGAIYAKNLLKTYHPLIVTAVGFLTGMATFLIPAILEYLANPGWASKVTILGILGLLYITILSSIVAFFLLTWALEKTDPIRVHLFQYLEPAVAATFAVPLLSERISYSFIVGTVLVVLGVYWGTLGREHHHYPHHKHHRS